MCRLYTDIQIVMMVSLAKGLAASLYVVVHSVPYQYQLDNFQQVKNVSKVLNAANNDSAYFFGSDCTINKQEKTAWQVVNRKADFFLQNESIRIVNWNALLVSGSPNFCWHFSFFCLSTIINILEFALFTFRLRWLEGESFELIIFLLVFRNSCRSKFV